MKLSITECCTKRAGVHSYNVRRQPQRTTQRGECMSTTGLYACMFAFLLFFRFRANKTRLQHLAKLLAQSTGSYKMRLNYELVNITTTWPLRSNLNRHGRNHMQTRATHNSVFDDVHLTQTKERLQIIEKHVAELGAALTGLREPNSSLDTAGSDSSSDNSAEEENDKTAFDEESDDPGPLYQEYGGLYNNWEMPDGLVPKVERG